MMARSIEDTDDRDGLAVFSGLPRRRAISSSAGSLALFVGAVIFLFPLLWMLVTALSPVGDLYSSGPTLVPSRITLDNFATGLRVSKFGRYFWNSVLIASATTLFSLVINGVAGFGFAKYSFRAKEILFLIVLSAIMVPEQVKMVAVALLITTLRWINTYQGVIGPSIGQATGVFLMRQYIATIPDELLEAARIDGASEVRIFWKIIIPLAKPAFAANAIIQFIWTWNSLLWPLIVLRREELYTVQLGLLFLRENETVSIEPVMAMALISALPILVIFVALQRYFVQGIALTGLK
jgi:ABC-type glycerol-3-phosphate transport system permease component